MATSNRRRRSNPEQKMRTSSSSLSSFTQLFEWSEKPVTVRQFVDQRLSTAPTIINIKNITLGYSKKFDIQPGSLFLIHSMFSQLLVIARNKDYKYLTIPLTSTLKFHLIKDDDLSIDPMTLSDMLNESEISSFYGQRVRLANDASPVADVDCQGELYLIDIYHEKYMLGFAFSGANLTRKMTIFPGYVPVTFSIARRMSGADSPESFEDYVSKFAAVSESFAQTDDMTRVLQDISVHSSVPHSDYDVPNTPIVLEKQIQPFYVNTMPSFSCSPEASSLSDSSTVQYDTPFALRMQYRPLPPIPEPHNNSARSNRSATQKPADDLGEPKFDENQITSFKTRRNAGCTKSLPIIHRTNSDPFISNDDDSKSRTSSRQSRLSSQSLENLNLSDDSSSPEDNRESLYSQLKDWEDHEDEHRDEHGDERNPPLPPKQTFEERAEAFFKSKRQSMLRRQRPVTRSRKGIGTLKYGQSYPRQTSNKLIFDWPTEGFTSEAVTPNKPEDQNIYEQIDSPIYMDMSSTVSKRALIASGATLPKINFQCPPRHTGVATIVTSTDDVYEDFKPREDGELYVNFDAMTCNRSGDCGSLSSRTQNADSRSGIVKPRIRRSDSGIDDENGYCVPQVQKGVSSRTIIENKFSAQDMLTKSPDMSQRDSGTDNSPFSKANAYWSSLDEVPTDLTQLTVSEVAMCLQLLNLDQYVRRFSDEQIDGDLLSSLDKDVLMEDFGFKRFDAIKLEKFARHGWRPRLTPSATFQLPLTGDSTC